MIDLRGWLGLGDDEDDDPVKKALGVLGQGASAAGQAVSDVGSTLSSAVQPYLPQPSATPAPEDSSFAPPDNPVATGLERAGTAAVEAYQETGSPLSPWSAPAFAPARAAYIAERALPEIGGEIGAAAGRAAGGPDAAPYVTVPESVPIFGGQDVGPEQVGRFVGSSLTDPLTYVGAGGAAAAGAPARRVVGELARGLPGVGETELLVRGGAGLVRRGVGAVDDWRAANAERVAAADARMAAEGSTQAPGTLGVLMGTDAQAAARGYVVPPDVARALGGPVNLPDDAYFESAITRAGGAITPDGVELDLRRFQKPAQAGQPANRGGVFYTAGENPYQTFYDNDAASGSLGGPQRVDGPTVIRNPLVTRGGEIGWAGWEALDVPGTPLQLTDDVRAAAASPEPVVAIGRVLARYGGDPRSAEEIFRHAVYRDDIPLMVQDNVMATRARARGHDAIIALERPVFGQDPMILEVLDLREATYPTPEGGYTLRPEFQPSRPLTNAERVAAADARAAEQGSTSTLGTLGALPEEYGQPYPPIRGDVRGVVREQLGEPSAEMLADSRYPRDVVHPDLRAAGIGPEITPQVDLSSRMNAGFGTVPEAQGGGSQGGRPGGAPDRPGVPGGSQGGRPGGAPDRPGVPGRRWVPDARYQGGGFWHTPSARVPDDVRAAQREAILRVADAHGDYTTARIERAQIERDLARAPDDPALQRDLMSAIRQEEVTQGRLDAAREYSQMVRTGDMTLTTAGTLPGQDGPDRLAGVNRVLGQGIASSVSGGVGAQVNQEMNPDDPYAGIRGFAAGALVPPLAARGGAALARRAGRSTELGSAARIGLGDVPPSRLREPTLPGMEPPYVKQRIPDVGEAPNRPPVLGDVPPSRLREPMLPGMEPPAPAPIGEAAEAMRLGPEQRAGARPETSASPVVQKVLSAAEERARTLAERGEEPLSPLRWTAEALRNVTYSSLIGPATAVGNVIANVSEPLRALPKELVRAVGRGEPREFSRMFTEGLYGLMGSKGEIVDAIKARGRYAANPDQPSLAERTINPVGHRLAQATEVGGRFFSGLPDAPFQALALRAGRGREASQVATDLGLKGSEWDNYVDRLLADVKAVQGGELPTMPETQRVIDAGESYANRQTFRDELGTIGKKVEAASLHKVPVLGPLVSPFFKTPWNIAVRTAERSPAGWKMNSQASRFDRHYDALEGSGFLAAMILGPAAAGAITGSGPTDPEKRKMLQAEGWQPYSTYVPGAGVYVPNRYFGTYGTLLNLIGDGHDTLAYAKRDEGINGWLAEAAPKIGKNLRQQQYLTPLAEILDMLDAPSPGAAIARYAGQTAAKAVPYAATARTIATALDPSQRQIEGGKQTSFGERAGQAFEQQVGARSALPPAQDVFGQPVENPQQGLWALGPRMTAASEDPIISRFQDAGVDITAPKTSISDDGVTVDLSPEETRRWNELRGEALIKGTQRMIDNGVLDRLPPARAKERLEEARADAAERADAALRREIGAAEFARRRKAARDAARVAS